MGKYKVSNRYLILIFILILWTVLYLSGRSPFVSELLKTMIRDQVDAHVQQKIVIDDAFVNPIPLFVELNGISMETSEGDRWFKAEKLKIYIDVIDLLAKRLTLRRVLLSEADVKLSKKNIGNVTAITALGPGNIRRDTLEVKTFDVRKTRVTYEEDDVKIAAEDIKLSAILKATHEIDFNIPNFLVHTKTYSAENVVARGRFSVSEETIRVDSLTLLSDDSSLRLKGVVFPDTMNFKSETYASLNVEKVSRMLNLSVIKGGRITSTGNVEYINGSLSSDARVKGEFYLESLMNLLHLEEPVRGLTRFDGNINIESGKITAISNADLINGHLYGVDIDRLNCDVIYDEERLTFKKGNAVLYDGTAEAEAYITLPRVDRFMIAVKGNELNALNVLNLIEININIPQGKVTGELRSEGVAFDPEGWFISKFVPSEGDVLKRITWAEGKFRKEGSDLVLENIGFNTVKSNMSVNGKIDLNDKSLVLYGNINTGNLSDVLYPHMKDIAGFGYSLFSVAGRLDDPLVKGSVKVSEVAYYGYDYDTLEASFEYSKELLSIDHFVLSSKDDVHKVDGKIRFSDADHLFHFNEPEFDIKAELRNIRIRKLLSDFNYSVPIDGLVTVRLSLNGSIRNIRADAVLLASPVSVYDVPMDFIKADVSVINKTFHFKNLILTHKDSKISGNLTIDLDGNYQFSTETVRVKLEQIPLGLNLEKGTIDIDMSGKGTVKQPSFVSKVKVLDVMTEGVPVGNGEINVELKDDRISASGMLFDGKTDVRAELELGGAYEWRIYLKFKRGVYDFIPAYLLKNAPEDITLNFEGDIELYGGKEGANGHIQAGNISLSMFGYHFTNTDDIRIRVSQENILFEHVSMKSGNASFSIEGGLVPYKAYDVTISGDSSLFLLKRVFTSINSIKGFGSFVISIRGDWKDPVFNGGFSSENASVGITGFPYKLVDLNTYIFIDNNRIMISHLSGSIGGGKIGITGYGYLKGLSVDSFYLDMNLKDAIFRFTRGTVVNCSGDLIYRSERGTSSIIGQIYVKRGRYSKRFDWRTQLLKIQTVEKPKGTLSPFENTALNIKINGGDNIVVDNNIAKTTLKIDLLLRGNVASPLLFGRIETEKGFVYFRNNQFEIIHASADFVESEKINPYFDITAVTSVKGYNIRIAIEGQMPHFNLSLLSDPPLEETDILGLLTVGETGSELEGREEGIGTAEATSFLTGKYQDVIEERLTMITGLDRFVIEPYVSDETGSLGPRVTVSKRLIGDKVFVTYSSSVGGSEEDIIRMEYRLNKHVSLVGEKDDTGTLGGDIKFRFEFK